MRIVHAIARLNVGGAALSVLELAAGQQRLGHDVLVVAGTIPPGEASMEQLAGELGVPYRNVPSCSASSRRAAMRPRRGPSGTCCASAGRRSCTRTPRRPARPAAWLQCSPAARDPEPSCIPTTDTC